MRILKNTGNILITVLLTMTIALGSYYVGHKMGSNKQIAIATQVQNKQNLIVDKKNIAVQTIADEASVKIQTIYKDRVVIKYVEIQKDIKEYAKTNNGSSTIDPDFVRLHDNAAADANHPVPSTESPGGIINPNAPVAKINPVTSADAIEIIADNYSKYYSCVIVVEGWQSFYGKLQKQVNE